MTTLIAGDDLGTLSEVDLRVIDSVRECLSSGTQAWRPHIGALREFGWHVYLRHTIMSGHDYDYIVEIATLTAARLLSTREIAAYMPRLIKLVNHAVQFLHDQWAADDAVINASILAKLELDMMLARLGTDDPYDLLPTQLGMGRR